MSELPQTGAEIAVIGLAGRFPGAASTDEFWRNLCAGEEAIRFFDDQELLDAGIDPVLLARPDYVKGFGYLDDADLFDAGLFGFQPREAQVTDPQHRQLLETAWMALEHAGYDPRRYRDRIGVFAGAGLSFYAFNVLSQPALVEALGEFQLMLGLDKDYLATRVAYKLGLTGPAVTVQTACSTSLVAVHLACQDLLAGECDMALAGGVAIGGRDKRGYLYREGDILSPDGHCRAFDAEAAGTVRGNGVGIVVLKRLDEALEDGDTVHAVIRGSAMNNDGSGKVGYTAPSIDGQAKVIRAAQELAEVTPADVGYIEAHGTGTTLGDPIEVSALERAFAEAGDEGEAAATSCVLGAVKTNIGHLDAAAGVAGLIKTVLALREGQLPPTLHFQQPNARLELEQGPFSVRAELSDWPAPRVAGVSSFGIGGTNVHLVLEQPPQQAQPGAGANTSAADTSAANSPRPYQLLLLSAATEASLDGAASRLQEYLQTSMQADAQAPSLAEIAHTLQVGRAQLEYRRALVVRDAAEAVEILASGDPERSFRRRAKGGVPPLAFLLPGQGSQYPGMARELYDTEPVVREWIDRGAEALRDELGGRDLRQLLLADDTPEAAEALRSTDVAQPALFVVQVALARLWQSWGVQPDLMLGHSVGEFAAAFLAEVFDFAAGARLVAARGRLMAALPAGAMLSVPLPEAAVTDAFAAPALQPFAEQLALAAVNGPSFCVVSGPEAAVAAFEGWFAEQHPDLEARRLHTSHAFHSPMMEPAVEPFRRELQRLELQPPQLAWLSNLSGRPIRDEEAVDPDYWCRHLRAPVRFADGLAVLLAEPSRVLLEVGPGHTLGTLARRHPDLGAGRAVLASLPSARASAMASATATQEAAGNETGTAGDARFLLTTLGRLWLAGVEVDWPALHPASARRRVPLPTYAFDHRSYWIDAPASAPGAGSIGGGVGGSGVGGGGVAASTDAAAAATNDAAALGGLGTRPELDTEFVAPRGDTEARIAELWQQLMGIEPVGVYDDFFELGGHSLLATQLAAGLRERFGVNLALRELFALPHVAGLAVVVEKAQAATSKDDEQTAATERSAEDGEGGLDLPPLSPDPVHAHDPFPLTDVQQAYWVGRGADLELSGVGTWVYQEVDVENLDVARFESAVRRLVVQQPMLRTVFLPDGRQYVLPKLPRIQLPVHDLSGLAPADQQAELARRRAVLSHLVPPADSWPLFGFWFSRLDGARQRLHLGFDMLLGDAWSLVLIFEGLARLYLNPQRIPPALEISFRDYVLAEEGLQHSDAYARALAYWRGRLETLPPAPELPLAVALEQLRAPRFARWQGELDADGWQRLKARAARVGVTPSGVLLAAFGCVLAAWSRHSSFTLNLTLFNRLPMHPQVNSLIGDFTSLLLLQIDADADSFEALARGVQQRLWDDLDHRLVSGVRVMRELAAARGTAGRAMMPVVFTSVLGLEATRPPEAQAAEATAVHESLLPAGEVAVELAYSISQTPQVLLDHQVRELPDGRGGSALNYNWDVVADAFPAGLVDNLFDAYQRLLRALADVPRKAAEGGDCWSQPAAGVSLLPSVQLERRRAVNETQIDLLSAVGGVKTMHGLVRQRAAMQPDAPAVLSAERTLTYGELDRESDALAFLLQERAPGARLRDRLRGRLIGVALPKGWRQAVAALAVLKAGGAYLPVDPALPAERFDFLLRQGEVSLALSDPAGRDSLEWPDDVQVLVVDDVRDAMPDATAQGTGLPDDIAAPDDLAYVIFTSGSTGQPKGVMIEHQAAVNTLLDVNQRFDVGPRDRVLALSSLGFDLSVYDLFGVFAAGGAVVFPAADEVLEAGRWVRLMEQHGVTLWNTAPPLMVMLLDHLGEQQGALPDSLRLAILSGDWIPVDLPARLQRQAANVRLISMGGATEASIWSIFHPVDEVNPAWPSIPYGKPMYNQTFHVLDAALRPRPEWVPGELYIGGVGLARGYWRDEAKTAAAFVPHPEAARAARGERLYRTGDLGRYHPNGDIEFLGREDFQVKVRGHRIELGEIESTLDQHPALRRSVVLALGERGRYRLVAFVVPAASEKSTPPSASLSADEFAAFVRAKLPSYMVPSGFVRLDELPLSASGKLDRRALAALAPVVGRDDAAGRGAAEPARGALEEWIAGVWAQVLDVPRVAPGDDFFELGGQSILATRVLARLREALGREVPLRLLFENPTVRDLAAALSRGAGSAESLPPLQPLARAAEGVTELPVSLSQQRLWFLDQLDPGNPALNMPVTLHLQGELDVAALYRAIRQLGRRQELLRAGFGERDGEPVLILHAELPEQLRVLPVVDLSALDAGREVSPVRADEAQRLLRREAGRRFDIRQPPLLRVGLLRRGPHAHSLLLDLHHLISDGWSVTLLLREIATLYEALRRGAAAPDGPLVQYADFAQWQRQVLAGDVLERQLAYWRDLLASAPVPPPLPTDRPREGAGFRGASQPLVLSEDTCRRWRQLQRQEGVTLFMSLLAVLQVLVYRLTGETRVHVGTPVAGRNHPALENLLGCFLNTLVLAGQLDAPTEAGSAEAGSAEAGSAESGSTEPVTFRRLLRQARDTMLGAWAHQDVPYERLVGELLPGTTGGSLYQVLLVLQGFGPADLHLPGLELSVEVPFHDAAHEDLQLLFEEDGESFRGAVLYRADLFEASTIERLAGDFVALLEAAAVDPEVSLDHLRGAVGSSGSTGAEASVGDTQGPGTPAFTQDLEDF